MSIIDTPAAEVRRQFTRMETDAVTATARPAESGFIGHTRDLSRALCLAVRGTQWRAEARAPYWPDPTNEIHGQTVTLVDARWMITTTHRVPAHTIRDLFTLTMNGKTVPYNVQRGFLPHSVATITGNVVRYLAGYIVEPCHALMCQSAPTVGIYGAALCAEHAQQYADTGTW